MVLALFFDPQPFTPTKISPEGTGQTHYYLVGELAIADPPLACQPFSKEQQLFLKDKIVYVERGLCTFQAKMVHLQEAGAKGMILANVVDENNVFLMGDDGSGRNVRIPSIMITKKVSEQLMSCHKTLETDFPSQPLIVEILAK